MIEELGINVFDSEGNMKSMDKVVAELEKGLKGHTKQQKASALATLFGSESTAGWTALLEKGSDELKDYIVELENSEGASKDMAETMQDTTRGSIVRMQSALSTLRIELGEKLLPALSKGADFVTDFAEKLSEMDDTTIQTIAELALLTTAVLGVTTAVAGVVAGIGALMAFAGPVGVAITAGTALLGGLGAMLYKSSQNTKKLKEEQEKAKTEATRYGENLSEGTKKAVKGYVDLYESAKLKMHELRHMSEEEAEKTVKQIQQAFSEMSSTVIAELEVQRDELTRAINEIYSVAGEHGKEAAKELTDAVLESFDKDIAKYKKASETLQEIIEEHGADVHSYPENVRIAYNEAWAIMDEGASEFAKSQQEMQTIRKNIAEREGQIMFDEAKDYVTRINDTYQEQLDATNKWYVDKRGIIDQALAQDRISADEHAHLIEGIETSTNQMFADAGRDRHDALLDLQNNLDERGKLLDLATGKELERQQVQEDIVTAHGVYTTKRMETDEEYYQRWLEHNEDILDSGGEFTERAQRLHEEGLADFLEGLGVTRDEAIDISKNLINDHLIELGKDDHIAYDHGKVKMESFADGIWSTKNGLTHKSFDLNRTVLDELSQGDDKIRGYGTSKGDSLYYGLSHTWDKNTRAGRMISEGVEKELSKTSDGGGGRKAGRDFSANIRSQSSNVSSTATSVARRGERGLRSVKTSGAGSEFVAGFRGSINSGSGSIWNTAWSLGQSALGALRSSIRTASPSKETAITGNWFTEGFQLGIEEEEKKAINQAVQLARNTHSAMNNEIDKLSQRFRATNHVLKANKDVLKIEHKLDDKVNEFLTSLKADRKNNNSSLERLLNATLQQNQLLKKILEKDTDIHLDSDSITKKVNDKNAVSASINYF